MKRSYLLLGLVVLVAAVVLRLVTTSLGGSDPASRPRTTEATQTTTPEVTTPPRVGVPDSSVTQGPPAPGLTSAERDAALTELPRLHSEFVAAFLSISYDDYQGDTSGASRLARVQPFAVDTFLGAHDFRLGTSSADISLMENFQTVTAKAIDGTVEVRLLGDTPMALVSSRVEKVSTGFYRSDCEAEATVEVVVNGVTEPRCEEVWPSEFTFSAKWALTADGWKVVEEIPWSEAT